MLHKLRYNGTLSRTLRFLALSSLSCAYLFLFLSFVLLSHAFLFRSLAVSFAGTVRHLQLSTQHGNSQQQTRTQIHPHKQRLSRICGMVCNGVLVCVCNLCVFL